jgi:hypothetical protein
MRKREFLQYLSGSIGLLPIRSLALDRKVVELGVLETISHVTLDDIPVVMAAIGELLGAHVEF